MKDTILVSGCGGFIGYHICEKLLKEGNIVIGIDNLISGQLENVKLLQEKYSNFIFKLHDIIHPIHLKCDQIYNLACPASPIHYVKNPIHTVKTNTVGVINMLELAKENNCRILHASTSEVYGDPEIHPQPETYNGNVHIIGPRSCYDEGKRIAETLIYNYNNTYGIDIRVARLFNTYGPNMAINDGRVISNFIVQALTNKNITIYGDGSQTRSFCYIDDMVDGLYKLMNYKESIYPINLGNPDEYTIKEIAIKIKQLIPNSKSKLVYTDLPVNDPCKRKPDITRANHLLKWKPSFNLDSGLRRTIRYFERLVFN